ncbi:MAG: methyl-accepting chemotaxis protein [Bacteroidota bacterium]
MKQLLQYFTPDKEMSLFEKQKTNSFIIINTIGVILVSLLYLQTLLTQTANFKSSISIISFIIFIIISLFILKSYSIKTAGNILSFGLIVISVVFLNLLDKEIPALLKYTQGFYTTLAMLTIGILYASQKIVIINFIIVLGSTIRVYFFAIEQSPDQTEMLRTGFINHTTTLILITIIIYFAIQFAENAINAANNDSKINKDQNKKLSSVFSLVKDTSITLAQLSKELDGSANSLSSNASEQAANIEEISATMEEMTGSIIQNAENTEETAKSVNNTTEFVKKSDEVIANSLTAIHNIDAKIGLIQEIASKTNLLALNAAIEAARAGAAGKGFSVVAAEVKKLADNSNEGAKEIVDLVKTAMTDSDQAGDYQKRISFDIENVNQVVIEISAASSEQRNSIEQINNSITQINEGAQENAAISEELAASVSNLALQAEKLNDILNENVS